MGVKCLETWNVAAVEKIAWKINMHGESLWIKWVHEIYMEGLGCALIHPLQAAEYLRSYVQLRRLLEYG